MVAAIFLTGNTWKIQKIMRCDPELGLVPGAMLQTLITNPKSLPEEILGGYAMPMYFPRCGRSFSATMYGYQHGNLVLLANISSDEEYVELANIYTQSKDWARDHLEGLFCTEYHQITQLNNQLMDSKRALSRANRKLKQAMEQIENTNRQLSAAEEQARMAMELAERASMQKSNFLASTSHDIRTPMNAITGLVLLMEHTINQSYDKGVLQEYLSKLKNSSQYLLGLLNNVLDLSKIEAGSVELHPEPVDLREQIRQVEAIIRPQAEKKSQQLIVDLSALKHMYVMVDGSRLQQVLANILSNSVKYTPEQGCIRLIFQENTTQEVIDSGCGSYVIVVEDNGMGMSEEYLQRIFEPYSRAEGKAVQNIQGTGLGMAIVKNLVEMMDGTIDVASELGKGTCFYVRLRLPIDTNKEASAIAHSCQGTAQAVKVETSNMMSIEGLRLLCAEDNELNAEILSAILELSGASCTMCTNGQELVATYQESGEDYDAVLTDINMPEMNGYEAARAIRKLEKHTGGHIPIVAMSADVFAEDVEKCYQAGMDDHVPKPIDLNQLQQVLDKYRE